MYQPQPQVLSTMPQGFSTDVDTRTAISIFLNTDIDRNHVLDSVFVFDPLGNKVSMALSYDNRVITITPQPEYNSGTNYTVLVKGGLDAAGKPAGIRSIVGKEMAADYTMSFTTVVTKLLPAPVGLFPVNQSMLDHQPYFQWELVVGAAFYQIKVASSPGLAPVLWPVDSDTSFLPGDTLRVDASYQFADGTYYWAVRAIDQTGTFGEWSQIMTFSKDSTRQGSQSPEDTVLTDVVPYYEHANIPTLEIMESFPADHATSVPTNLKTIYMRLPGNWTDKQITPDMIAITGVDVNGFHGNPEYPDHGNAGFTLEVVPQQDGTTLLKITLELVTSQAWLPSF